MTIEITRWKGRNWALCVDGELLAVTVYRRGAMAVAEKLQESAGGRAALFVEVPERHRSNKVPPKMALL